MLAAIAGELVGEILGIADAEDLRRRIVPETPGRKGDRGQQGFQMARRQVDDQPPDLALPRTAVSLAAMTSRCQFIASCCLRVELGKAARGEKWRSPAAAATSYSARVKVSIIADSSSSFGTAPWMLLDDLLVRLGRRRRSRRMPARCDASMSRSMSSRILVAVNRPWPSG